MTGGQTPEGVLVGGGATSRGTGCIVFEGIGVGDDNNLGDGVAVFTGGVADNRVAVAVWFFKAVGFFVCVLVTVGYSVPEGSKTLQAVSMISIIKIMPK